MTEKEKFTDPELRAIREVKLLDHELISRRPYQPGRKLSDPKMIQLTTTYEMMWGEFSDEEVKNHSIPGKFFATICGENFYANTKTKLEEIINEVVSLQVNPKRLAAQQL